MLNILKKNQKNYLNMKDSIDQSISLDSTVSDQSISEEFEESGLKDLQESVNLVLQELSSVHKLISSLNHKVNGLMDTLDKKTFC